MKIRRVLCIFAAALMLALAVVPVSSFAAGQKVPALTAPTVTWSVLSPTTASWNTVSGAVGYNWQLWYSDLTLVDSGYISAVNGQNVNYTLSVMDKIKAGSYGGYTMLVQAVADPKSTAAVSSEYGRSAYLNYTSTGFTIGTLAAYDPSFAAYPGSNYLVWLYMNNIRCTLDIHNYTGYVGDTKKVNASVNTPYTVNTVWTSSDESVATVDDEGLITLVGPGVAVITVTDGYAGSDSCLVTVKKDKVRKLNNF